MFKRKQHRLKNWDYSWPGIYFLTLCTKEFKPLFGTIINAKVILSPIGNIVNEEFIKSFSIRETLHCIEYIIMPDHMHMIVEIMPVSPVDSPPVDPHCSAGLRGTNLQRTPRSISSFIACFKSKATKRINDFRNTPGRQVCISRFHDHIVRSDNELNKIRRYIIQNPYKAHIKSSKNSEFL